MKLKLHNIIAGGVAMYMSLGGVYPFAFAQTYPEYQDARSVVQRTEEDLHQLRREGARNEKERERVDNARKHLSDFDRNLSRNKFDKGRLDSAIDDVKNVVEHDTLQARDRDALTADLNDLRRIRELRGR
jgi:hypothetical protein